MYKRLLMVLSLMICVGCVFVVENAAMDARKSKKKHQHNAQKSLAAQRQRVDAEIKKTRAAILTAQQVLAEATQQATAAQGKGAESQTRVDAAMATIGASEADAQSASEFLELLEDRIESSQSVDSEFGRAKAAFNTAEQRLLAARDRVLNSPEYKAKYEKAVARGGGSALAAIGNEVLNADAEYDRAKRMYDSAKKTLAQERAKLLDENSEWGDATADAREARRQLADAQNQLRGSLLHKTAAAASYRNAMKAGTAARATIQRGSANLKRLEQQKKNLAKKQQNNKHSSNRSSSRRKR